MARPSKDTPELRDVILTALIEGESLRQICARKGMPDRTTVMRWLDADESFASRYARAREMQGDHMDDLILETANDCTPESAPAARVKIDAYKWRAAKLNPKRYGERLDVTSDGKHVGDFAGWLDGRGPDKR